MVTLNTAIRAAQIQESTISGGHLASINSPTADYVLAFDSDQDKFKWVQSNEFVINEIPDGDVNGSNKVFTLSQTPLEHSEQVFLNGLLQERGSSDDYTITSGTITFNTAPEVGDIIMVSYLVGCSASNIVSYSYGYVAGGGETARVSTIERFQFPFDSGIASIVGNLTGSRAQSAANNSSEYGYIVGGHADIRFSIVDRITFPFDSGTAEHTGDLTAAKRMVGGNNSSLHGYVIGGWDTSSFSAIDRFQFPFDSGVASHTANLSSDAYQSACNNSSTYGYVNGDALHLDKIDRFQFPFDSGITLTVGNLAIDTKVAASNNSSLHGYVCGGLNLSNISAIQRFQFPFDSGTAAHVGNLNASKLSLAGNNSSIYGYAIGGYVRSTSIVFSSVERCQFPFNSGTAVYVGTLAEPLRESAGLDTTDFVSMFV